MAYVDVIRLQFQSFFFSPSPLSAKRLFYPLAYSSAPAPPATLAFAPRKQLLSFKVTSLTLLFPYSMHSQLTNISCLRFHSIFLLLGCQENKETFDILIGKKMETRKNFNFCTLKSMLIILCLILAGWKISVLRLNKKSY